jgi:hypothetical protein
MDLKQKKIIFSKKKKKGNTATQKGPTIPRKPTGKNKKK